MKRILFVLGLLAVVGGVAAYFVANKPHENINKAKADLQISAEELFSAYEEDENGANQTYLDKLIEITGKVSESKKNEEGVATVTLDGGSMMFGVICQLDELTDHPRTEFPEGETITLKGKCTGMLMDVVLVRCVEVNDH